MATGPSIRWLVIQQDTRGVPLSIVILIVPHRPKECDQTNTTKDQRNGDEYNQYIHFTFLTRRAFNSTVTEDVDIAKAANSGVAKPRNATGMAMKL